ncbi:MAG TPA: acylphosphatase [Anaerolineales bacterium]|jgi:acylphosphatase|nr:acylphosphatase [Anaerolineales bacterium]
MSDMGPTRLHAIVEGRVQGVGFRAFAIRKAEDLNLTGWVRNRWDDSVEVVAEGDRATLDRFVAALFQGPTSANVTRITPEWQAATGEFPRFSSRSSV